MLSIIFKLRMDWYTNKGQTSNTVNEIKYSGIPIRSPTGPYCAKKCFLYRHAAQRDRAGDSVILGTERKG